MIIRSVLACSVVVGALGCQSNVHRIDTRDMAVVSAAVASQGDLFAAVIWGQARCFRLPSGEPLWTVDPPAETTIHSVAFNSDGDQVVVKMGAMSGWLIHHYRAADGAELSSQSFDFFPFLVGDLCAGGRHCIVWDGESECLARIQDGGITPVTQRYADILLSPDGLYAALIGDGRAEVRHVASGRKVQSVALRGRRVIGVDEVAIYVSDGDRTTAVFAVGGELVYPIAFDTVAKSGDLLIGSAGGWLRSVQLRGGGVETLGLMPSPRVLLRSAPRGEPLVVGGGTITSFMLFPDGFLWIVTPVTKRAGASS